MLHVLQRFSLCFNGSHRYRLSRATWMRQGRWQKPRGSSRQRLRLRVRAGVFPL